ncbi:transposase [Caballeronia sp. LZ001]|uniref:transposase n=1 Tax=Caballeronia sp. LZ001 TaxID=3038553 RepID=UPI00285B55A9|nr:transposase [Caballeronia sp. LZ001]MDR5806463.1 transposase [Caballeronia sp. LZ001]
MHTISQDISAGRTRRTYSASFKSELINQCRQVGVSCSAVAISHGLNPNVLRRWIKAAADPSDATPPGPNSLDIDVKAAFIALPMTVPTPQAPDAAQVNVRIDIQRNGTTVSVLWPQLCLSESAAWVREVLR